MAANGKRGTAIDAAAIPLADGGAEGGAARPEDGLHMTGTLLIHSLNVATEGSLTLYTCPMWQWMNCPEILRSWRARQSRVLLCIPQTTI